jgi:hypothetical protein
VPWFVRMSALITFAPVCYFIPFYSLLYVSTIPNSSSVKKIYVRLMRVSRRPVGYGVGGKRRLPLRTGEGNCGRSIGLLSADSG